MLLSEIRNCCEKILGKTVKPSGLWLHPSGIIGASPDGLIDNNIVIQIKCLPRYEGKLDQSLRDSSQKNKTYNNAITHG